MKFYENYSLEDIKYIHPDGTERIEQWKDVPEFENFYQISNIGRFKSLARVIYKRPQPDRIIKQCPNRKGYLQVLLHKNGTRKNYRINRLVGWLFIPNPENKPEVNHMTNESGKVDKTDNTFWMLEWNTGEENRDHAIKEGLNCKGESVGTSKLIESQVLEIRANANNLTHRELGVIYGVSRSVISGIISRKTWKHI